MQKFNIVKSIIAGLPLINIDTDMIIPKQFLKTIKRTGLGKNLFHEMRYDLNEHEITNFVLNKPEFKNAKMSVIIKTHKKPIEDRNAGGGERHLGHGPRGRTQAQTACVRCRACSSRLARGLTLADPRPAARGHCMPPSVRRRSRRPVCPLGTVVPPRLPSCTPARAP